MIKIFFVPEAAEKPISFSHHLKLHPYPLPPAPAPPAALPPANPADPAASASTDPIPEAPVEPVVEQPLLTPVHAWQYEEIVFSEPTETFYAVLLSQTPTALPRGNRLEVVDHTLALSAGGNIGEFSLDMEAEEGERLEEARKGALAEIELMRQKLISNEKELSGQSLLGLRGILQGWQADLLVRRVEERGRQSGSSYTSAIRNVVRIHMARHYVGGVAPPARDCQAPCSHFKPGRRECTVRGIMHTRASESSYYSRSSSAPSPGPDQITRLQSCAFSQAPISFVSSFRLAPLDLDQATARRVRSPRPSPTR